MFISTTGGAVALVLSTLLLWLGTLQLTLCQPRASMTETLTPWSNGGERLTGWG